MPDGVSRLVIGGILFLHGIAHGGAIGALWWISSRPGTDTGTEPVTTSTHPAAAESRGGLPWIRPQS